MRVYFTRSFLKKLDKSPEKIREHFEERIKLFVESPFAALLNNHALRGQFSDHRSINITGDWRAVFKFEDDAFCFVDFGTHSQLYKK